MKQSLRYFKNIFERNISLWLSEKWNNIYEKLWINSNDVKKIDKDTLFKLRKENPVLAKKQDDEVKEVNNKFLILFMILFFDKRILKKIFEN